MALKLVKRKSSGSCGGGATRHAWMFLVTVALMILAQIQLRPRGEFLTAKEIAKLAAQQTPVFLPPGFDVLDIGASKGEGSIEFMNTALRKLKLTNSITAKTIGIDIDPYKVKECLKKNNTCIEGNVLQLQAVNGTQLKGTTMWHVLEHMPTCDIANDIWNKATAVATMFASFHGPCFDDADILRQAGFHRFYEDWTGHSCHFDSKLLMHAIESSPKQPTALLVALLKPISSSDSPVILPFGAEPNSHYYDSSIHPPKTLLVDFSTILYEEMRATVIYESLETMSLYSALALNDVLSVLDRFQGILLHCQVTLSNNTVMNNNEECKTVLETLVADTIQTHENMGIKRVAN